MLVVTCLSIPLVSGQSRGRSTGGGASAGAYRGGDGSVTRLLWNSKVQAELKLDESQRNAIAAATKRLADLENVANQRIKLGPDQAPARSRSFPALINEANQELDRVVPRVLQILTEKQRKRLQQIRLQVLDFPALLLPEVSQALRLSPKQKQDLHNSWNEAIRSSFEAVRPDRIALRERNRQNRRNQAGAGSGSFRGGGVRVNTPEQAAENLRRREEMIKNAESRIRKEVLTPQQDAKFEELKGRPFEVE